MGLEHSMVLVRSMSEQARIVLELGHSERVREHSMLVRQVHSKMVLVLNMGLGSTHFAF